ncbi:copper-binding protein [Methylosinus sp. LW3]|uniref:copper-binding protein n=1 Tax=Methylosinus sp. LW3 TaxID=107635 RepID=UPI0005661EBE|nr:copper-binding protein [Methylosinus sp. LW3]
MLSSNKHAATIFSVLAIAAIVSVTVAYAGEASRTLIVAQAAEKAEGEGIIKGVVAGERKLQIAHGPIAALNWPGMTMAFGVASGVDVSGLMPGAKVRFTLSRDAKGLYVIESIRRIE